MISTFVKMAITFILKGGDNMNEFINWRTTIIGILGAVSQIVLPIVQEGEALHTSDWISAGLMALLGIFAKDANKI